MTMLAEYGTLSLADVLAPAIADGRRLSDRGGARRRHRAREGAGSRQWPYSTAAVPDAPGRGARGAACRARSSASPTSPRRCASWSRPSSRRSQAGKTPQGGDLRRLRPLLQGRHRAGVRARRRRSRAGSITMEDLANWKVQRRGAASRRPTRASTSTSSTCGRRGRRCCRRSTSSRRCDLKAHGLQQRALHPHALPGDEPRLRRPRLLLRRSVLPAGRAAPRAAVEGLREAARRKGIDWAKNDANAKPGDPYPFQGGKNPYVDLLAKWPSDAAARRSDATVATATVRRGLPRRHDVDRGGGRGGLGRVGDAERRLDPGVHRRARPASA